MSDQYGQGGPQGYGSQPGDGQSYGSASQQYGSGPQQYGSAPQDRPYGHPVNAPQGQYASAPQGYSDAPFAHGSAPMPEPERSRGRGWIVGAVLLLTAVASFALVTILMHKKSTNHDAMAPAPSTVATSPSAAAPSASGSAGGSQSASSSPSSSSAFPPDTTTTCMSNSKEVPSTSADDVRMVANSETSCGFLDTTRSAVIAQLSSGTTGSFDVSPYSASLKHDVELSCSVSGGYTYCAGGRSAKIWVRNP